MSPRIFFLSILIGISAAFTLSAEESTEPKSEEKKQRPAPPTHIPPPPPNLKPPSKAPDTPPPPRQLTEKSKPDKAPPAKVEEKPKPKPKEVAPKQTRKMTLGELLNLPPEQLKDIRDTIDKLSKLSPEEKDELRKRLDELKELEESEKKRKREEYLARRREFNKQARILLWERMSKEEKAAAQAKIDAAETKQARHQATQVYIKEALKDQAFKKEVNQRTNKVLKEKKAKESPKKEG
ncbi:MAG: DUF3106 domain-containing protein [Opitutales bacterium]